MKDSWPILTAILIIFAGIWAEHHRSITSSTPRAAIAGSAAGGGSAGE